MGSELWEDKFDSLLGHVKDFLFWMFGSYERLGYTAIVHAYN